MTPLLHILRVTRTSYIMLHSDCILLSSLTIARSVETPLESKNDIYVARSPRLQDP